MEVIWKEVNGYEGFYANENGLIKRPNGTITPGHLNGCGYYHLRVGNGKKVLVHRLIAIAFLDNPEGKLFCDHKDRDRTNNQVENIRWATQSDNSRNRTKQENTTSKFMGVHFREDSQKWQAGIKVNGKAKHLGYHETELAAAQAYDKEAVKHGFNHLNFPTKTN
jgi:hypothetical protein